MPGSPFLDYSSALFSANSSTAASNSSSALTPDKTSQNKTQKVPSLLDEDESTLEFCSTYDYTSVGVFISSIILNRFVEFGMKKMSLQLVYTTLQSMMNAKLSLHGFWHCQENGLIKTI